MPRFMEAQKTAVGLKNFIVRLGKTVANKIYPETVEGNPAADGPRRRKTGGSEKVKGEQGSIFAENRMEFSRNWIIDGRMV